jgi:hypothetical protein
MTRRLLTLTVLALLAIPVVPGSAEARRGGGFSRSFGGGAAPSRRSSWGSAKPEGYRGKGGVFGGSSRGQGFGPGRGLGGRPLLSRSQATPAARSTRAESFRRQYQQPVTVINNTYYGGGGWGGLGWGMRSVGMWDLFFLSTVNQLFWYHHWNDAAIQRALYQDHLLQDDELHRLEGRVHELEAKGAPRDPDYLPEGVDPDLAHSKEYVDAHPAEFYAEDQGEGRGGGGLWVLLGLGAVGLLGYGLFLRRY